MLLVVKLTLSRVHPIVLHSYLQALWRYDPDALKNVCDELRVNPSSISALAKSDKALSDYPVRSLISIIFLHPKFDDISRLAGDLATSECGADKKGGNTIEILSVALSSLVKLLPSIKYEFVRLPSLGLRIKDSPFVISESASPTCGFISGFLSSILVMANARQKCVYETMCVSTNFEAKECLFEISKSPISYSKVK